MGGKMEVNNDSQPQAASPAAATASTGFKNQNLI
jgi:hypothetical protein